MRVPDEHLENELRRALRPEAPPASFAERVFERVERERTRSAERAQKSWRRFFATPALRWAAAGVLCLAIVGAYEVRQREQRLAGEEAKRKVMLALRITSAKMQHAESRAVNGRDE
jgi:hypothetical protein